LYTLPDGSWTQRDAIRERIIEGGVTKWTTKLMGTRESKLAAWEAVRGNPSKMKDAEGETDEPDDCVLESQPLELNSEDIRLRIMESGTRFPA
jgi:hypothetical protein